MDRAERLRQLREQHRLVAQHLRWLEGEMAQLEGGESDPPETARPTPSPLLATPAEPAVHASRPLEAPFPESSGPSAADQARRQKLGCILVAILGTAILLFLLWGLPELIYADPK